jgi:rhodanese-related sulfurtransferase
MKIKKWIVVVALVISASETPAFAHQGTTSSGAKPQNKQEQLAPVDFITPDELKTKVTRNEPVTIIDVRGPSVFAQSDKTIKGSIHVKVRRASYRLRDIPHDREVVAYCACPNDEAAVITARALLTSGFKRVRVLKGGWNAWLQAGGPVEAIAR